MWSCVSGPFVPTSTILVVQPLTSFTLQQIERWLNYQYKQSKNPSSVKADPNDPMTVLMARIMGVKLTKQHKNPAYYIWVRDATNKALVDKQMEADAKKEGRLNVNDFTKTLIRIFKALPAAERDRCEKIAQEEHKKEMEEWEMALTSPFATDPESRQK